MHEYHGVCYVTRAELRMFFKHGAIKLREKLGSNFVGSLISSFRARLFYHKHGCVY